MTKSFEERCALLMTGQKLLSLQDEEWPLPRKEEQGTCDVPHLDPELTAQCKAEV